MKRSMDGKIAVVTGVTSGIGEALVARLLAEGALVVGLGRSLERLREAEERLGPRFTPIAADLARPDDRRRAAQRILEARPPVDIVINNAAECVYEAPLALSGDAWRRLFEVNVFASLDIVQALAPAMAAGAHIVNVSSVAARFLPNARFAPYAISKIAIDRLTEALRLELAPRGVRVTVVVPGLVDTPIYDKIPGFDRSRERLGAQVPKWLSPDDVADAIVWALTRPASVVVSEMVLLPAYQPR